MIINNQKGMALAMTLFVVIIIMALQGIFVLNVITETRMARIDRDNAKAFYAAHGAANLAVEQLDSLINDELNDTISLSNPSGVATNAQNKVTAQDGIGWLEYAVAHTDPATLTKTYLLYQNGEEAIYPTVANLPSTVTGVLGEATYSYRIVFSENGDPRIMVAGGVCAQHLSTGTNAWEFPYNYRVEATGTSGGVSSNVVLNGDFTVCVQKENLAKYALFTNNQSYLGNNVWFTNKTNFSGPVFTNNRFNFALNPSGTFLDDIKQYQTTARFYNNNNPVLMDADNNGSLDVPTFGTSFTRNQAQITLTPTTDENNMIGQSKGSGTYSSNGIYVPNSGTSLTNGIYVKGDLDSLTMSVNGSGQPVYTLTQGAITKTITLNKSTNQTLVKIGATTTTYSGLPSGTDQAGTLIYVSGGINSFAGTVESDEAVTVATHNDLKITNNVQYASYTDGSGTPGISGYVPPSAEGSNNLLGIVSWAGDVRITSAAPNNISVHGTILAPNGVLTVDNYNSGSPRGTATLLGGIISDEYGAFGTFDGSTGLANHGYGRNFVYDKRMDEGNAPPYFPTLSSFNGRTNDITDKLVWQEGNQ